MQQLDAIFFDFDGVLAESVALKEDAFREMFVRYGDDVVDHVIKLHRKLGAISRVIKIDRVHRDILGAPLTPEELEAEAQAYATGVERAVIACPEVPGTTELLEDLAQRSKLFVVSGTPEEELRRIVSSRRWHGYFQGVYGSPRLKAEIVRAVLAEHDLDPESCLFVGDTFTDHDAAMETDLNFVGRRVYFRPNPFPTGTIYVDDMQELADLLAGGVAKTIGG